MKYTIDNPKIVDYFRNTGQWYFTGVVKDEDDVICFYENGLIHRTDGPAIISGDGHQEWLVNGKRHRENGPAVIYDDGSKHWFINGKSHREDGPSVEYPNGKKVWRYNGTVYGYNDDFTIDSWTKKWCLEIFK